MTTTQMKIRFNRLGQDTTQFGDLPAGAVFTYDGDGVYLKLDGAWSYNVIILSPRTGSSARAFSPTTHSSNLMVTPLNSTLNVDRNFQ